MDNSLGLLLLLVGVVLVGWGVTMQDGVQPVEVCINDREPAPRGATCPTVTEQRYVEHEFREPLLVAGGIFVFGSLFFFGGEPDPVDDT